VDEEKKAEVTEVTQAKSGDIVRVRYRGTLEDGTEFDSSEGRDPLEFKLGEGMVISGFDNAVMGMKVGESKDILIPVEEAYGPHRTDLVLDVERSNLPAGLDPEIGDELELEQNGNEFTVRVTLTTADTITLDANHALAGKALNFNIELVEIA